MVQSHSSVVEALIQGPPLPVSQDSAPPGHQSGIRQAFLQSSLDAGPQQGEAEVWGEEKETQQEDGVAHCTNFSASGKEEMGINANLRLPMRQKLSH